MIGWSFPSNNNGQEQGPNHPGIETFLNDPLTSLAKEICQNSCDARAEGLDSPVEVHFDLQSVPASNIPGLDQLRAAVKACCEYWQTNDKGKKIFERARAALASETIRVLRISDYNTDGLTGSGAERGSNWHNLVKAVGASDKPHGKLGSFGIGKHAPFACSAARTVFYSSLDKDGNKKFQGVSILATHQNVDHEPTQGTGYYGLIKGNAEITDDADIPAAWRRNQVGSGIFVLGFGEFEDWQKRILRSLLDNFFKAIHDETLVVQVGTRRVNAANLRDQLEELAAEDTELLSPQYFESITDNDSRLYTNEDFECLGRIELHLLPRPHFPKRVAMVRRSGMVVFHKGHFRTPVRFAGVLQIRGGDADNFFQQLEPPAHDKWEVERFDPPEHAKKMVQRLYAWINERVREMNNTADLEEQDAPGMSEFLPDAMDEAGASIDGKTSGEKTDKPKDATVELRPKPRAVGPSAGTSAETGDTGEDTSDGAGGENDWDDEGGRDGDDGGGGGPGGGGPGGDGDEDGAGAGGNVGEGDGTKTAREPLELKSSRCFCIDRDAGIYSLVFSTAADAEVFLHLRAVGETERERMPIVDAFDDQGTVIAQPDSYTLGPIAVKGGQSCRLQVKLPDHVRCALELSADEN